MKKPLVSCLPMFLAALFVTACIYDFNPDLSGEEGFLVVEGDIVLGQTSRFSIRRSSALDSRTLSEYAAYSNLCVEASDGTRYPEQVFGWESTTVGSGQIDLTGADPSLEYRLVFDCEGRHYASDWSNVVPGSVIDSLSFTINEAGTDLAVKLSTHSAEASGYYRWTAVETWEYLSDAYASHFFAPAGTTYYGVKVERDTILPYQNGENLIYCWNSSQRSELLMGTTETLTEDRLVNHQLYTLNYNDERVSRVYSVEVSQTRISEEAYRYWEKMQRNSTDIGGLFSPEPSEVRGNVVNVDDPAEMVLGFVSIVKPVSKRMFIVDSEILFYRDPHRVPLPEREVPQRNEWTDYFYRGYLPTTVYEPPDPMETTKPGYIELYHWLPARCVDCRMKGGTKNKPDYWPTPEI
ncbi:MAG: DUF4249 domain-containing protein [Bacteroidales bacterium]|nr:DUF4249 domain-containing protein [Bacteroidales bacterium]